MYIQPVIVIYNKKCNYSSSVMELINQGAKPIIVDNSTIDNNNKEFCIANGLIYYSMEGNKGLSKAYNKAISLINEKVDFILWMDDDTILPNDFLDRIEQNIALEGDADIYLPIVQSGNRNRILSPSVVKNTHTYRVSTLDEIKNEMISAINSGMLVRRTIYDEYKYDENLFLDCIDHDFIKWCYQKNITIKVLKHVVIDQCFSGDDAVSRYDKLQRFRIFKKDYKYYRNKNRFSKLQTELFLIKRLVNILLR